MTVVYLLLFLILVALIYLIYRQSLSKPAEPDLSKAISTLVQLANEKFDDKNKQISTDLTNKKTAIEEMVKRVLDELAKSNQKLELAEQNRIGSFSTLTERLEEQKNLTQQLKTTTDNLKRTLSNDRLRGQFGEEVAEELLKSSGFVEGVNYQKQTTQTGNTSRPDFTIILPNGMKINVDAKFPYSDLVKMSETEDTLLKDQFLKSFHSAIKTKIKEISSRDYINVEDNTVDFVVLFIPNEMVFSFIYERFPDIRQEAYLKKVVLAGPYSFTAILRMVQQAYDNFHFQKDIHQIVGQIKEFLKQFDEYNKVFDDLGKKIDSVARQYDELEGVRTRQLLKSIDKIKAESLPEGASPPQLPA